MEAWEINNTVVVFVKDFPSYFFEDTEPVVMPTDADCATELNFLTFIT